MKINLNHLPVDTSHEWQASFALVNKLLFQISSAKYYIEDLMSDHVLLNLLNELRERDKMRGFLATSLINSIIQEHKW